MDMLGQFMVKDTIEAHFGDVVQVHEKTVLEGALIAKCRDVYNREGFISPGANWYRCYSFVIAPTSFERQLDSPGGQINVAYGITRIPRLGKGELLFSKGKLCLSSFVTSYI